MDIQKLKTPFPLRKMIPWLLVVGSQLWAGTLPWSSSPYSQLFLQHMKCTWADTFGQISNPVLGKQDKKGSFSCCVLPLPWSGSFLHSHLSSGSGLFARLTFTVKSSHACAHLVILFSSVLQWEHNSFQVPLSGWAPQSPCSAPGFLPITSTCL